jgi:hypothetical protein
LKLYEKELEIVSFSIENDQNDNSKKLFKKSLNAHKFTFPQAIADANSIDA